MTKTNCYRIYTEEKNYVKIIEEAKHLFSGFTVYCTTGYWNGKKEMSLVIEAIDVDEMTVLLLAKWIKRYNCQESVMITREGIEAEFV